MGVLRLLVGLLRLLRVLRLLRMHGATFLPVEPGQKKSGPRPRGSGTARSAFSRSPPSAFVVAVDRPGAW